MSNIGGGIEFNWLFLNSNIVEEEANVLLPPVKESNNWNSSPLSAPTLFILQSEAKSITLSAPILATWALLCDKGRREDKHM